MIITKVSKASDKKLDEEFPSLSSLPKKNPPPPVSIQRPHSTPAPPPPPPNDTFPSSDARSPENILQTELTQQDFCHALSAEMNLIPDPPYDAHEVDSSNAIETPPSYPQTKNMKLIQPEFFKKYDLSTLFFIFFYSPGTSQQYFAGRELQNRDWYYHIKYQTWFHRLEEPKEKTAEYEIAKYEYFDHATNEGWCVRQRLNFRLDFDSIVK
ncbi:hypothetical protein TRFO_11955 [Tritrichomonas foetus]|uniref:NOT2/NOT3/NOT5 C-terminal domain-containing protein n=1 Tax=Tritrichomonas foetus TaxID=1144522 RepID=A0A1J4J3K4_9EUKA|nr:hypothetical protein TRFO_11955 [Tritrichomonas foetus]|eukprot:OHS93321.1 hypothetical protein TRFO_11955 [Tritrichomonas foetus]